MPTTVRPGIALYVAHHHRASADSGVGADRDRAQHLGASANYDVFRQGGVALAVLLAGAPQGYPLVQQATVADLCRFTDHHTHAMVDEDAMADTGAGVDFNSCEGTTDLAEAAGGQLQGRRQVQRRWLIRCRLIAWKPG